MSDQSVRSDQLDNGLLVTVHDVTRHYFGGYWQVALEVRCEVPVSSKKFADAAEEAEVRRVLGDSVLFVRRFERMAVPGSDREAVCADFITRIEQTILPFLASSQFPVRFVEAELKQRSKRVIRGIPCLQ